MLLKIMYQPTLSNMKKALLLEQAKNDPKNAGKPENILEKMLTGRLKKENERNLPLRSGICSG